MDTMSDAQMSQQTEQTGDSIPNFLMLEQIPTNYVQQIETDLLEPVVFSQGGQTTDGFARFTLQNKGFLHSHSKIFVALDPAANIAKGFLQPQVGIGQIIKKAVLKIGNKALNELDSWSGLHAVKSSLITNENNYEREMFTTGRWMAHEFDFNADSRTFADDYSLDTGNEKVGDDRKLPSWYIMGQTADECPSFQIDLSDLFPFLKVNQLPLYMIREPITIELTFQPTLGLRLQTGSGDMGSLCDIVRSELKFCADYIYYGATDEMARFEAANQDMSFSFVDYRLVENTTTAAALGTTVIRNLGMANRIVPRIITVLPDTGEGVSTILGGSNSIAPFTNASGVQGATAAAIKYNVRYNDRFEYTSDVDSLSRLFSNFTQSEGVPFITRSEFSNQSVNAITDGTIEGRAQRTAAGGLEGHMFYLGTRLTNGRVGQRGIEIHVTGDFSASGSQPDLMRTYCEYVRVARLSGGFMEIFNA